MSDQIKTFGRSIVQHGPGNDRAYLMKLDSDDFPHIIEQLDQLALSHGYSKIFAKIPECFANNFIAAGYEAESVIPSFYPGGIHASFMCKYFSTNRRIEPNPQLVQEVLAVARSRATDERQIELHECFTVREARPEDATTMASVYRDIFATYPFPIHDPEFIRGAMAENTVFFGIWNGDQIAALSSAEIDKSTLSAEMTDFATPPEFCNQGLALHLLRQMEKAMQSRGIRSLYTIARAYSYGMNITFARNGYRYGGMLTNNTNISGSLESMNVWHKTLSL